MDKVLRFRVDSAEKRDIEQEAKGLGLSVSAFMRFIYKQWKKGQGRKGGSDG